MRCCQLKAAKGKRAVREDSEACSQMSEFLMAIPTEWYSSVLVTTGKRTQGETQERTLLTNSVSYSEVKTHLETLGKAYG